EDVGLDLGPLRGKGSQPRLRHEPRVTHQQISLAQRSMTSERDVVVVAAAAVVHVVVPAAAARPAVVVHRATTATATPTTAAAAAAGEDDVVRDDLDRKSTRLNSSHVKIS